MKRFAIRFLTFAALVVAIFGTVLFALFYSDVRRYYDVELKMPPEASVVTINDSQTSMCIDPAADGRFFNCSAPSRTMDQAYLVLLDLLKVNPGRIKTVLVDVSPSSARENFNLPVAEMGYASQYYLLHLLHPEENVRAFGSILPVVRDHLIGRRWRHVWRSLRGRMEFHSSFGRIPTPRDVSLAAANPEGYERAVRARVRSLEASEPLTDKSPVFRQLDRIVDRCVAEGVEAVLVTTPWDEPLLAETAGQRRGFTETVAAYARKRGLRYLDFLSVKYPADLWFDPLHLTVKGGRRFTGEFARALFGEVKTGL